MGCAKVQRIEIRKGIFRDTDVLCSYEHHTLILNYYNIITQCHTVLYILK